MSAKKAIENGMDNSNVESRSYSEESVQRDGRPRYWRQRERSPSLRRRSPSLRRRSPSLRRRSQTSCSSSSSSRQNENHSPSPPSQCLGVLGLPDHMSVWGLRHFFRKYGPVKWAKILMQPRKGSHRGFALVYFEKLEDAISARKECINMEFNGRPLRVDYSDVVKTEYPTGKRDRDHGDDSNDQQRKSPPRSHGCHCQPPLRYRAPPARFVPIPQGNPWYHGFPPHFYVAGPRFFNRPPIQRFP